MRRFSKTVKPCDVFPLVIRTAADGSCYEGYIDAGSQSFYIRLSDIPDMRVATTLKGAKLDFGDKLGQALGEYGSWFFPLSLFLLLLLLLTQNVMLLFFKTVNCRGVM